MRIATVSASVRFSKALGDGQHKTVELSAEASLDDDEVWTEAQGSLYHQLGEQLKTLWANGKAQEDPESHAKPTPAPTSPAAPEHYCQEHKTQFKRYEKDGHVWRSHRAGNQWCKEK
jgi:hypothetical protein